MMREHIVCMGFDLDAVSGLISTRPDDADVARGVRPVSTPAIMELLKRYQATFFGRGHRMLVLEKLLRTRKDGGAEFLTMEAAATAYDARFPFRS